MPRKGYIGKRDVLPDPIYKNQTLTKFINQIMLDGKKGTADAICYSAFEMIQEKSGKDPIEVFGAALKNVMPVLEVKARRVGGANYQVPIEVRAERRTTLGLRWLVAMARKRGEKPCRKRLLENYSMPLTIQAVLSRRKKICIKWQRPIRLLRITNGSLMHTDFDRKGESQWQEHFR